MPFNFQVQEFLFYQSPKGIIDTLELKNRLESLFKATLWLSVSTEAGEKTKWVVRCRRNGREISVNYRVEPFRGWDECEVFVTRHRSRLLFLVLNINNPAPSFATPSFVPPSPPPLPASPPPPPRLTSRFTTSDELRGRQRCSLCWLVDFITVTVTKN